MVKLTQEEEIIQAIANYQKDLLADLKADEKVEESVRLKAKTRKARQISEGILLAIRRD